MSEIVRRMRNEGVSKVLTPPFYSSPEELARLDDEHLDIAEDLWSPIPGVTAAAWQLYAWVEETGLSPEIIPPPQWLDTAPENQLHAYVNHGRWCIDCPCKNADVAARSDPRYWCWYCRNRYIQGKWVLVKWPPEPDEIETILLKRPIKSTRNWYPWETIDQLRAENELHGV